MSRPEDSRLAFVDSLRLFAAMLVVFQHLAERHRTPAVSTLVEFGPGVMGMVLFFLVSGYVIPFSVRSGLDVRAFLIRRLCRIYPLFLAAIMLVAFCAFRHPQITLAQVLGPWTIAPALFFAVILPNKVRGLTLPNRGWIPVIGSVSYSIYLLHPIANAAAEQYARTGMQVGVALTLTLILSIAGYHLVEKPGIAIGRRLAARVASRSLNQAALPS
jgi:peptidoglycan/LPS O-acetylase OafA/YrhL